MPDPVSLTDTIPHLDGDDSPVTLWLRKLETGDTEAAEPLFHHFCTRLQDLVRRRIPTRIRGAYDDNDASASAFHSIFLGVQQRRYQFRDRSDFWRLLLMIAERKVSHRIRHEHREKRDVGRLVEDAVFQPPTLDSFSQDGSGVDSVTGREPTPEFVAEFSETCDAMFASLPDDQSRRIAVLKLENHTADEIAAELGCARRTVQRKLLVIRRIWQDSAAMSRCPNVEPDGH